MKNRLTNGRNAHEVFFIVFFFSILLQGLFFYTHGGGDLVFWSKGAEMLAKDNYPSPGDVIFGYPGTLFLLATAFFIKFGFDSILVSKIVMTISLSIFIAWATLICYKLQKDTWWWAYAGIILTVNPIYSKSTLPSAHIIILSCLIILMTLYILKNREKPSLKDFLFLGTVGGLSLTCRFDLGLVHYLSAVVFLVPINILYALASVLMTLLVSLVAIPFIWEHPINYFINVLSKISDHASSSVFHPVYDIDRYINAVTIYGILSLVIGIFFIFRSKSNQHIPKVYLVWLASITIIIIMLLLSSDHHPPWLFFPIAASWEVLIPLLFFTLKDEKIITLKQNKILLNIVIAAHIFSYISCIII